jgi:hypothetical protein
MDELEQTLDVATPAAMFDGTPLWDIHGLEDLLIRFALTVVVLFIIIQGFYYPKSHRKDYHFTFTLIGVSIFMLMYLMGGVKLKVGVALGLFAIFGIIRYRTEAVPIREMTYLFLVIAIAAINSMATGFSWVELVVTNLIFILSIWVCEHNKWLKHVSCKYVKYDNINLITPDKREELKADLEKRTGLKVTNVEIGSIDFLKDMALIKMYYEDKEAMPNEMDSVEKMPRMYD